MGGTVYLLHFTTPYKHARHYLGATGLPLDERIAAHRGADTGRAAKLVAALLKAGGDFVVVRLWATKKRSEAFEVERQLKRGKNNVKLCPLCTPPYQGRHR